eukprot:Opistho-2@45535
MQTDAPNGVVYGQTCSGMPSLEDWRWANHVIDSRGFGIQVTETRMDVGLVPLADLFNAASRTALANCRCRSDFARQEVRCYTTRKVAAGSELLMTYAHSHSNVHYLLQYGFAFPSTSDYEVIHIFPPAMGGSADDPRNGVLNSCKLNSVYRRHGYIANATAVEPALLAYLRVLHTTRPSGVASMTNGLSTLEMCRRLVLDIALVACAFQCVCMCPYPL